MKDMDSANEQSQNPYSRPQYALRRDSVGHQSPMGPSNGVDTPQLVDQGRINALCWCRTYYSHKKISR